jgi:hypothetical protein
MFSKYFMSFFNDVYCLHAFKKDELLWSGMWVFNYSKIGQKVVGNTEHAPAR